MKVDTLKRGVSYIQVTTDKFCFKDVLNFTAQCSYDKFTKVWNAPTSKSIWPYSYYENVEEIKAAKKFPPYKAFISKLNPKKSPSLQQYIEVKREFHRRKLLPKGDKEKINSMLGWLRYYNVQDVGPLAVAIENCFASYKKYFEVDPLLAVSLPSLAQTATFLNYRKTDPLVFSFSKINKEVHALFRANVLGGVVNVYHRHVSTFDQPNIPVAARHAPNGEKFSLITMFDFTSMYLSCQQKEMPTTPGILWTMQSNGEYKKNIMTSGHSFKAQQWLVFMQESDPFLLNANGKRSIIQTAYHRGEHKIPKAHRTEQFWTVDGFAITDHGCKIYEFNGERYHKGCPHCAPNEPQDFVWRQKMKDVSQCGEIQIMWECQFDKLLNQISQMETPSFPDILKRKQKESDLLEAIRLQKVFGFIVCDVVSDTDVTTHYHDFPPVVKRFTVTEEFVLPWMKNCIKNKYNSEQITRPTLIQCFNAKDHLLMTPVAHYYMKQGLKISNIKTFVQYLPVKVLEPFANHVTSMRIAAEKQGNPTKSMTSKLFGNSGYGKHGEKVEGRTKSVHVTCKKKLKKLWESPMFKTMDFLGCENDEGVTEVIMLQRKVRDDKPVHLAVAILQYSKLMMLQFVDFVKEHLIPGSYVLVYSGLKETIEKKV